MKENNGTKLHYYLVPFLQTWPWGGSDISKELRHRAKRCSAYSHPPFRSQAPQLQGVRAPLSGEQPRFPSRSGVFTQVGCVLPSLHCTSAQPQVEALCWRAGQTDEVSISLYVVPLFQGTALILSHYSVRMHVRKGHQPLPQSRSAGSMWICSFSHCLHTLLQKESTNTCTMQSK